MQRGFIPLPWRAKGLSDTIDGSTAFNGAMASLSNLIPDPTTANLWECRPASVAIGTFAAGSNVISALKVVGTIAYGLISQVDGKDHPFAFNLSTNAFITVAAGGTGGTIFPASQPATGAWQPPIMDVIGSKLVVTHQGFSATA